MSENKVTRDEWSLNPRGEVHALIPNGYDALVREKAVRDARFHLWDEYVSLFCQSVTCPKCGKQCDCEQCTITGGDARPSCVCGYVGNWAKMPIEDKWK